MALGTLPDSDEDLRRITGIDADEEAQIENAAKSPYADSNDPRNKEIDDRLEGIRSYNEGLDREWAERVRAIRDGEAGGAESPDSLKEKETEAAGATQATSPQKILQQEQDGDKNAAQPEPEKQKAKGKGLKSFIRKHRTKLLLGVSGGGGLMGLLVLLIFLASSLLLPHFFENMMTYAFSSSARSFRQTQQQILARKLGLDKMDDTKYSRFKTRMANVKKMVTLEAYRPEKITQNMFANETLSFEKSTPSRILRRQRITAIVVEGERIPIDDTKWYIPFRNPSESLRLSQQLDQALFKVWRGPKGTVGTILRTSVGSKILQQIGVRGLWAWANRGREYRGKSSQTADIKLQAEAFEKINDKPRGSPAVDDVRKAADDAAEERAKEIQAGEEEAQEMARTGEDSAKITRTFMQQLRTDTLKTITSFGSTAYSISVPACMILEASMQHSGPAIESNMASLQRSFMYVASGANQVFAGATTGEALGAMNRKYNQNGEFARSDVQQMAAGGNPSTLNSMISPEGSVAGDFAITNVLLPEGAAEVVNNVGDKICPTLTKVWVGVGVGVAELVAGFFTGGGYTAASKAGSAGVGRAFAVYLGQFAKTFVGKANAKRVVRQGAIIGGLSLLAYNIAHQYSGSHSGISRGKTAADEAFAGAVAMNQTTQRQVLGGRPLTADEARQSNIEDRQDIQNSKKVVGFADRYFSLKNPQSLLAQTIVRVGTSINTSLVGSFLTMLGNVFNPARMSGLFATTLAPKAQAANMTGSGLYGIVPVGFSSAEYKLIETHSTYWDLLENDYVLFEQNAEKTAAMQKEYQVCFTEGWGTLLPQGLVVRREDGTVVEDQGLCSPRNLGVNNPKYGDLVFRWRVSMRADNVLTSDDEVANPGKQTANVTNGPVSGNGRWRPS